VITQAAGKVETSFLGEAGFGKRIEKALSRQCREKRPYRAWSSQKAGHIEKGAAEPRRERGLCSGMESKAGVFQDR